MIGDLELFPLETAFKNNVDPINFTEECAVNKAIPNVEKPLIQNAPESQFFSNDSDESAAKNQTAAENDNHTESITCCFYDGILPVIVHEDSHENSLDRSHT